MDAEFSEINITPFTDVLLVLLVIFMILAALVVPPGFERKVPCNCASPARVKTPMHADVTVARSGDIYLNGVRQSEQGLYPAIASLARQTPRLQIRLIADAHAHYGPVIRVFDAVKAANLSDVTLVTQ